MAPSIWPAAALQPTTTHGTANACRMACLLGPTITGARQAKLVVSPNAQAGHTLAPLNKVNTINSLFPGWLAGWERSRARPGLSYCTPHENRADVMMQVVCVCAPCCACSSA